MVAKRYPDENSEYWEDGLGEIAEVGRGDDGTTTYVAVWTGGTKYYITVNATGPAVEASTTKP